MQILVVCRPAQGGDQAEFRRLVPAEGSALRELKKRGVLSDAWTPGRPGAVLMLDVGTEDEAAAIACALPLAAAGLITTEVIPLHPMNLLRRTPRPPRRSGGTSPSAAGRDLVGVEPARDPHLAAR